MDGRYETIMKLARGMFVFLSDMSTKVINNKDKMISKQDVENEDELCLMLNKLQFCSLVLRKLSIV